MWTGGRAYLFWSAPPTLAGSGGEEAVRADQHDACLYRRGSGRDLHRDSPDLFCRHFLILIFLNPVLLIYYIIFVE